MEVCCEVTVSRFLANFLLVWQAHKFEWVKTVPLQPFTFVWRKFPSLTWQLHGFCLHVLTLVSCRFTSSNSQDKRSFKELLIALIMPTASSTTFLLSFSNTYVCMRVYCRPSLSGFNNTLQSRRSERDVVSSAAAKISCITHDAAVEGRSFSSSGQTRRKTAEIVRSRHRLHPKRRYCFLRHCLLQNSSVAFVSGSPGLKGKAAYQ